jgi:hypothetical protein
VEQVQAQLERVVAQVEQVKVLLEREVGRVQQMQSLQPLIQQQQMLLHQQHLDQLVMLGLRLQQQHQLPQHQMQLIPSRFQWFLIMAL